MTEESSVYEVVSPAGKPAIQQITALSPRAPDLDGKTICQVWNNRFQADKVFSALNDLLIRQYPNIKIVPCTDMPVISFFRDQDKKLADLKEAYLQKGCDAVITSTGG